MDAQASEKTQKSRAILGRSGVNGVVTDHIQVFLITILVIGCPFGGIFGHSYHDLPFLCFFVVHCLPGGTACC